MVEFNPQMLEFLTQLDALRQGSQAFGLPPQLSPVASPAPSTAQPEDLMARIRRDAEELRERLRAETGRRVQEGEAVRFDPLSGIQPLTQLEMLRLQAEPTLRRGPDFQSSRENLGPLGQSNFGDVGIGDFIPFVDQGLAADDLAALTARERAGLDVGTGEKVGAAVGTILPGAFGLRRLSKFGGELFDKVARRLRRQPSTAVFEKLAKEGIPVNENIRAGKEAIAKVLSEQTSVPAAMYRPDVGEITFDFGDRDGGIAHIIARRASQGQDGEKLVREILPEVLARGKLRKLKDSDGGRRAEIAFRGHLAVLNLTRNGKRETWVLTAHKERRVKGVRGRTIIGKRKRPARKQ